MRDLLFLRKKLAGISVNCVGDSYDLNYDNTCSNLDVLYMKRYLCGLIKADRFERITTAKVSDFEATVNIIEAADKVKKLGRYAVLNDSLCFAYAASGLEFCVNSTGNGGVGITFDWKMSMGQIGIVIDGNYDDMQIYKISKTGLWTVVAAKNLTKGNHTISVQKVSDQNYNRMDVQSISFDGTLGDKPADKSLKMEFYGDSITCGVGSLMYPGDTPNPSNYFEDGCHTYATYTANALGADISVCAQAGYGWQMSWDGKATDVIGSIWDDALPNENVKWNFEYKPDIVVFALNTNDNNYCKNSNTTFTVDSIKRIVTTMIENVRSKSDCKILLVGGFNTIFNTERYNADAAMKELALNGEDIYYIDKLPGGTSGVGYHPTTKEHYKGAEFMIDFIKNNMLEK